MKKAYKKPNLCSASNIDAIVPLAAAASAVVTAATSLAPAVALVGAYAVGRSVKQAMEMRPNQSCSALECIIE